MHLQCLPIKNYVRAGYVDDPLPNTVNNAVWMSVWLYYVSSSTVWWFLDHFSVTPEKKTSVPCSTWLELIYQPISE